MVRADRARYQDKNCESSDEDDAAFEVTFDRRQCVPE